jgi:hypothetical protein
MTGANLFLGNNVGTLLHHRIYGQEVDTADDLLIVEAVMKNILGKG